MTPPHPIVAALTHRTRDLGITWAALSRGINVRQRAVRHWRDGRADPFFSSVVAWADHVGLIVAVVDHDRRILAAGASITASLADLRRRGGVTQQAAAERRNVRPQCVSTLERGARSPYLSTLDAHLDALGLQLALFHTQRQGAAA